MRLIQTLAFATTVTVGIAFSPVASAQDAEPASEAPTAFSADELNGIEERQVNDLISPASEETTSQETVNIDTADRQWLVIFPYDNGDPEPTTQIESRRILITPPATSPINN